MAKQKLSANGRPIKYEWEKIFKMKGCKFRQGKDFTCSVHGMMQQVRNAARRLGVHVSMKADGTTINLQILDESQVPIGRKRGSRG